MAGSEVAAAEAAARDEFVRLCKRVSALVLTDGPLTHRQYRQVFGDLVRVLVLGANRELATYPAELESRMLEWPDEFDELAAGFLERATTDLASFGSAERLFDRGRTPPSPDSVDTLIALAIKASRDESPERDFVMFQEECAWMAEEKGRPLLRWMDCLAPSWHGEKAIDTSA